MSNVWHQFWAKDDQHTGDRIGCSWVLWTLDIFVVPGPTSFRFVCWREIEPVIFMLVHVRVWMVSSKSGDDNVDGPYVDIIDSVCTPDTFFLSIQEAKQQATRVSDQLKISIFFGCLHNANGTQSREKQRRCHLDGNAVLPFSCCGTSFSCWMKFFDFLPLMG